MSVPKILDRSAAAALLASKKKEILRAWEAESRQKVPAALAQTRLALDDSLPQFLDQLVETLRSNDPKSLSESNAEVAREHGEDRAAQPDYTLAEVICEFRLLRGVIMKTLESEGIVDAESNEVTHNFLDCGIGEAAVRYAELEADSQALQNKELEYTRLEAERASQAKSAFLANMSHEIRTPLGAIMGFVGLLKDTGLKQSEIDNYLSIIDRNSHHLLRIIDDILDLTKVEAGKMAIENIEFSLIEFLTDFSSLAGIKARENGIGFDIIGETSVPNVVVSDPTRIRQILSNVVGNAIKFTERGRVELAVSFSGSHLNFKVSDTGRGISPEQSANLFQAFSQADSSTTRKYGGTGLGLVLTKKLSKIMGGDFDLVGSKLGSGSTFAASVNIKVPSHATLVPLTMLTPLPNSVAHNPGRVDLTGFEILVVEDSTDNQFLIQQMLGKTNARVAIADNGEEGVRLALSQHFDAILMDIQMPLMDGYEAVRILRAKGFTAPIIALTAHAMKEERERAVQSGFSYFLSKPIHTKSLMDLMELIHNPSKLKF